MFDTFEKKIRSVPVLAHLVAVGFAFAGFHFVKTRLDESYAASGHPVDYATGQLAFASARIEEYYAVMQHAGTLNIYVRTQFIDFGFIAMIALLSLTLGTFLFRINRFGFGEKTGLLAALAGLAGAGFDTLENLLSFVMLAQPDAISQAVAVAYSSAAAAKFAMITLAMALVLVSAGTAILGGLLRLRG